MSGLITGADGVTRCSWAGSTPDYLDYHDTEWGVPVHGERALYERLTAPVVGPAATWLYARAVDGMLGEAMRAMPPAGTR